MDSLVSVIIPIYNAERFIKACVESVMSQTFTNIEIILVNDGSTDNSLLICEELAKSANNIFVINQKNSGVSFARNVGIKHAKGKYITFLDADDKLTENAIKALVDKAEKSDFDMIIGKMSKNETLPICVFEGEQFLVKVLEDNSIGYYAYRILYKREFVRGVKFMDGFVCAEDSYFVFECALKKPSVATIDEQVYIYNLNPYSVTQASFTEKRYNDICELLDKKEYHITKNYPHLIPIFYHLKTKTQMMLLRNLSCVKGKAFRKKEKETLTRFKEVKQYFRADLPYSNVTFYNVLSKDMYWMYKILRKTRYIIKKLKYKTKEWF